MARHSDNTLLQFLLTMAFVVAVAIFNWIKRRSQSQDTTEPGSEPKFPQPTRLPAEGTQTRPTPAATVPQPSRPAPKKINWEEELRRMLEGNEPAPPPVRPAPVMPAPAPPPLPALRPAAARPVLADHDRGLPVHMPGLTTSAQTYQRASQLDASVANRLHQVTERVRLHQPIQRADVASQDIAHTLALLRNKPGLRSAIMASVVLGPPKALEG